MDFVLQQALNGLVLGSVYALYGAGFGLVMANLRIFHVAHAAVFTWGAVVAWELTARLGWSLLVSLPVVMLAAGLLNVLAYVVLIRRLLVRRDSDLAAFVSSLGGLIVLVELAREHLGAEVVRMPAAAFTAVSVSVGPVRTSTLELAIVVLAVGSIVALSTAIARTQAGRELRAVAHDRTTAALLGIDVDRVSAGVFFASGALAGLGASLVAVAFNVVEAELGSTYLLLALAAMVVGGFGTVLGTLGGGLLIGLASTFTTAYLSTSFRDFVVFALLLAILVVRPQGLFQTASEPSRV